MSHISDFIIVLLTAVVLQNVVFTRALGTSKHTMTMASHRRIIVFGLSITAVATVSSAFAWPLNYLVSRYLRNSGLHVYLRYGSALLCICLVYVSMYLISRRFLPKIHYYIREIFVYAAFNCSVLGSILIAFSNNYSLWLTIGFAFGSGIGYTLAMLLIFEGKRRVHLSDVPIAFRGMPSMLLYIGILSLAFYGLIGYQLPT